MGFLSNLIGSAPFKPPKPPDNTPPPNPYDSALATNTPSPKPTFDPNKGEGLIKAGNIDIHHRPRVPNPDGSISTVRSASFDMPPELAQKYGLPPGAAVLLPTVLWNPDGKTGRIVTPREAMQHFIQTGENLGFFKNNQDADTYSQSLHQQQAQEFNPQPGATP